MSYLDIDGTIIDEDTGEVIEGAPDAGLLNWAAHQLAGAQEQQKAWAQQVGALKAVLMRELTEKKAVVDGLVVNRVSGGNRRSFNREAWRRFMEDEELTLAEWREIALSAASIDTPPANMTREVFDAQCFTSKRSSDYITVAPVRRVSRAKEVEKDE